MSQDILQAAKTSLERGLGWAGLPVDGVAFVASELCRDERWLIVVDGSEIAERLFASLRFFVAGRAKVHLYPADDRRPYDGFSAQPTTPAIRFRTLAMIGRGGPIVVIAPAHALMARIPDVAARQAATRRLASGLRCDRDELVRWLVSVGYLASGRAETPGSFSVRGDVVDIWPMLASAPVRVDFFDDEIEDLRRLDPETLRNKGKLRDIDLWAAREEYLDSNSVQRLGDELSRQVVDQGRGVPLRRRVFEDIREGIRFSGIEDWLPALVPTEAPPDVFSDFRTMLVHPEQIRSTLREAERSSRDRWLALGEDERPLVPPEERYVSAKSLIDWLRAAHRVEEVFDEERSVDLGCRVVEGFSVKGGELEPVAQKLRSLAGTGVRVGIVVDSAKRVEPWLEMFGNHGLRLSTASNPWDLDSGEVALLVGKLSRGFIAAAAGWAFIPSGAFFGERKSVARTGAHAFFDAAVGNLADLREGDFVVHRRHGIGQYRGLKRIRIGELPQDFVHVEYRDGDRLLLPATRLEQLSRYVSAHESTDIKLDRLGGATWQARQAKVRDSILKMAQELLAIYARRELAARESYEPLGESYRAFEERFPYDETLDQLAAIDDVNADLDGEVPMDRLLCGDVGYGKTEVAMRAAMRAVESGRQVLVLCPTTVLAFQHLQTFKERFDGFPVVVDMLSRLRSGGEERSILDKLRSGKLDILIGTTRVLGREVRFKNLGLVVIDEEHRFGVRQKERLKKMRAEVDVLSMSATPIPRTLQMGLSGMRAMSVMATPPRDRLSVRTTVSTHQPQRIRDAILMELAREGQVFFVHNRVQNIERVAEELREWVPEASVAVAHGQMEPAVLERILINFIDRRTDVLVASSIIESGIDIPNVNTMIVDRADQFGLGQLYQLRGRVGRGAARAHCLLLLPDHATAESRRRVQTLVDNVEVGSGFRVAVADLEMRGAGNLIGDAQSGNIDSVGYETWLELLEEAVSTARGELALKKIDPEVELPVAAFLPETMFPDVPERLAEYRKLSMATRESEVEQWRTDLSERFGALPVEVENLAGLAVLRILCRDFGVVSCSWLKIRVSMAFHVSSRCGRDKLTALVAGAPKRFALRDSPEVLGLDVRFLPQEAEQPILFLRWVFAQLRRL